MPGRAWHSAPEALDRPFSDAESDPQVVARPEAPRRRGRPLPDPPSPGLVTGLHGSSRMGRRRSSRSGSHTGPRGSRRACGRAVVASVNPGPGSERWISRSRPALRNRNSKASAIGPSLDDFGIGRSCAPAGRVAQVPRSRSKKNEIVRLLARMRPMPSGATSGPASNSPDHSDRKGNGTGFGALASQERESDKSANVVLTRGCARISVVRPGGSRDAGRPRR